MKRHLLVVALYLCVFSASASAQGLSIKSAELSVSAGGMSFSKKTFTIGPPQASTPINGSMQLNSGTMYEARINFYTSRRIGAEVLYGYQYSGVTFKQDSPLSTSFSVPLQIHTLGLNLLYYPLGESTSAWRPFISLGGGAVIYRPSTGGQASAKDPLEGNFDTFFETSRGSGSVGAGVKRPLTKSIGFRVDAGATLTKVPTFGLPESSAQANATVLPVGGLVHSFRASAGLIFYLGK
jgi:outer membrane protein with beta-barrel domain